MFLIKINFKKGIFLLIIKISGNIYKYETLIYHNTNINTIMFCEFLLKFNYMALSKEIILYFHNIGGFIEL